MPRDLIEPYWNVKVRQGKSSLNWVSDLIEPYWNVKDCWWFRGYSDTSGFNRTILECKGRKLLIVTAEIEGFNRTILECKVSC